MTEEIPLDVYNLFQTFTHDVIRRGFKRYSSDAILHRIRWYTQIEVNDREFKVNNNWSAPLARWFMTSYPEHKDFFALRRSKHDDDTARTN